MLADEGLVESAVLVCPRAGLLVVELKAIFILAARLLRVPVRKSEWLMTLRRTRKGTRSQWARAENINNTLLFFIRTSNLFLSLKVLTFNPF